MFINTTTLDYPVTLHDLRVAHPKTMIGSAPSDADLAALGYARVVPAEVPEHNPISHSVSEKAPVLANGKYTQQWEVYALEPGQVSANMEAAKRDLAARVTEKRWEVETGGIIMPNSIEVKTGLDDQNRINSVIVNAERAGIEEVDFKSAGGWVTISVSDLEVIADYIAAHVQQCFAAERVHHEAIEQLSTPNDIASYDITAGWPSKQKSA